MRALATEVYADEIRETFCRLPDSAHLLPPSLVAEWRPVFNPSRTPLPQPSPHNDIWIARAQAGDENAVKMLIRRLYPTILKSVRRHLPKRTSEEDLVQSVLVKVFNRLNQFSGLAPLEHWVSRITVNTCINQLRHEAVRPELRMGDLSEEQASVLQERIATHPTPSEEISGLDRDFINHLMTCLKPDERLVMRLRYLEDRSLDEVKRMTGWSLSKVKIKAFRARHKMRSFGKSLLEKQETRTE